MDETPLHRVRRVTEEHGLPGGLMPDSVRDADIDDATGRFRVTLTAEHERQVDGIPVWYATTVTGVLTKGRIEALKGVKARVALWVPVTAIEAEGDGLWFSVGPVRKRVPRDAFVAGGRPR